MDIKTAGDLCRPVDLTDDFTDAMDVAYERKSQRALDWLATQPKDKQQTLIADAMVSYLDEIGYWRDSE